MSDFWKFLILIVVSYLLGNVTFARLFSKTRKDDITSHGSGNPGTMNMLRTYGVVLAILTLVFDALKSVIACLIGYFWLKYTSSAHAASLAVYICGLACVIGHNYPVIFKFKGGKGVATALGFACVARPILIPLILVVFITIFAIWKVASVSSLSAVFAFLIADSIILLMNGYYSSFIVLVVIVSFIVYAHRSNINRLFTKKENKIDLYEAVQKDKEYAQVKRERRMQKKQAKQNAMSEKVVDNIEENVKIEEDDNNN